MSDGRHQARELLLEGLRRAPWLFDFYQAMRRLECVHRDKPRLGEALRPADEPVRLGQEAALAFPPTTIAALLRGTPPRVLVRFFGLLGPNGPMPLHFTEYARDRVRNADDPTLVRFLDVFHHRMLLFFYRAWSEARPHVSFDRPEDDRFAAYTGALMGIGAPALQQRDAFPDRAKLFYVGRLAAQTRNAEGLAAIVSEFFGVPARVEEFIGAWFDLPDECRWRLGGPLGGRLGQTTIIGARAWLAQQKFRVALGPLDRDQFQRMLPGGPSLKRLIALVRHYAGPEMDWDVRLVLDRRIEEPMILGRNARLGWTSWLGRGPQGASQRDDLVFDPLSENVEQAVRQREAA